VRRRLFRLPWPCYGTPELKHPGSPNLYQTSRNVMDGGGNFRANFGVERDGVNLLAEDGSYSKGADLTTGYPEFDHVLMKKLGWWDELTETRRRRRRQELEDRSFRRHPARRAEGPQLPSVRQREGARVVWNFPDGIPQHREPIYSPRPDLVAKYPTHDDKKAFWRLPTLYKTVQQENIARTSRRTSRWC
jgi:formate dehydrogenase major subunit